MGVCSVHVFVMLPGNCYHRKQLGIILPCEDHFLSMTRTLPRLCSNEACEMGEGK